MKFKKGDQVVVTVGKDKGKKAAIDRVLPAAGAVVLAGINLVKRHTKKRDEQHPGGIIERAAPLSVGKIALICPSCHKQTRVGYLVTGKEKVRVCRKCEQKI